ICVQGAPPFPEQEFDIHLIDGDHHVCGKQLYSELVQGDRGNSTTDRHKTSPLRAMAHITAQRKIICCSLSPSRIISAAPCVSSIMAASSPILKKRRIRSTTVVCRWSASAWMAVKRSSGNTRLYRFKPGVRGGDWRAGVAFAGAASMGSGIIRPSSRVEHRCVAGDA